MRRVVDEFEADKLCFHRSTSLRTYSKRVYKPPDDNELSIKRRRVGSLTERGESLRYVMPFCGCFWDCTDCGAL